MKIWKYLRRGKLLVISPQRVDCTLNFCCIWLVLRMKSLLVSGSANVYELHMRNFEPWSPHPLRKLNQYTNTNLYWSTICHTHKIFRLLELLVSNSNFKYLLDPMNWSPIGLGLGWNFLPWDWISYFRCGVHFSYGWTQKRVGCNIIQSHWLCMQIHVDCHRSFCHYRALKT